MISTRLHVYEFYHAWLACYGKPPALDDILTITGYRRGTVYAVLWRLGLLGVR